MTKRNNNFLPLKTILNLLDNRFKFEIIYYLLKKKLRFGEIKYSLSDINQQLLTKLLKQLEKDKLIKRKKFRGFPRKVEYEISTFGLLLKPLIDNIYKWEEKNKKALLKYIKINKNNSLYDYY